MWRRETLERHHGWARTGSWTRTCCAAYWRYGQYRAKTCGRHPENMRQRHMLPSAIASVVATSLPAGSARFGVAFRAVGRAPAPVSPRGALECAA
jgi:hypothetical protein